jgi:hypothetical protein
MYKLTITHRLKSHDDISPAEDKKRNLEKKFDQTYGSFIIKPSNPYRYVPDFDSVIPIKQSEQFEWLVKLSNNELVIFKSDGSQFDKSDFKINKPKKNNCKTIFNFQSFAGKHLTFKNDGTFDYYVNGSGLPCIERYIGTWKKIN